MKGNQPLHVLKSYLDACEVPYTLDGETLTVNGKTAPIKVQIGEQTLLVSPNECVVGAKDIMSPTAKTFLSALHTITNAAGYGEPLPVDRGEAPSSRINYRDQFESVYLRHSVFRRSPNPKDMAALDKYRQTIEGAARRALRKYRWILEPMGFDVDDLINIGRVHTIAFIHYYAAAESTVDNIKLLTEYLKQRFSELARLCHKKAANATCLPNSVKAMPIAEDGEEDAFTHYLNIMGDENAVSEDEEYAEGNYTLTANDGQTARMEVQKAGMLGLNIYVNGHLLTQAEIDNLQKKINDNLLRVEPVEIKEETEAKQSNTPLNDSMSPYQRRVKARGLLFKGLDNLSPEEREISLAYAVYSRDYEPDARVMARKLCEELYCPKCKTKVAVGSFCRRCGTEAQPRYGVDYKAIKQKLTPKTVCAKCGKEDCTCSIGEKTIQVGGKAFKVKAKPETKVIYPEGYYLAESMTVNPAESHKPQTTAVPVPTTPTDAAQVPAAKPVKVKVPRAPDDEIKAAEKKMIAEFWATLPDMMHCPKHNNGTGGLAPKDTFRPLVALRFENGMPKKIRHTSYCVPCFKAYSKKSN